MKTFSLFLLIFLSNFQLQGVHSTTINIQAVESYNLVNTPVKKKGKNKKPRKKVKKDRLAVISLILALASLIFALTAPVTATLALIFSRKALKRIKADPGNKGGKKMAIAALIISIGVLGVIATYATGALFLQQFN